jgi:ATP-binding cassette, subfamily B, bacterial
MEHAMSNAPSRVVRMLGHAARLHLTAAPVSFAISVVCTVVTGATAALLASVLQQLIDELARGALLDGDRARAFAVSAAAITCGSGLLSLVEEYARMHARAKVAVRVEAVLMTKLSAIEGLGPFEDPAFLGRLRLAAQAAADAPQALVGFAATCVRTAVAIASLTYVVWGVSPAIAGLLLATGVLGIAAQIAGNRWARALTESVVQTERWHDFYASLLSDVRAAKENRLFGLGPLLLGRLETTARRAADQQLRVARVGSAIQGGFSAIAAAMTVAGTFVVVDRIVSGLLSVGDVSLFLTAVAGIQASFGRLVHQLGAVGDDAMKFEHYLALTSQRDDRRPARLPAAPLQRGISIRDAWFRYTPESAWVLKGLDLEIRAGASLGLVGVNGAGKSTLVKLLCGFHELERGQILWDGVDIRAIDPVSLRRRISATFQDFMTYDFSAAENIGLGRVEHIDDHARIEHAARQAEIADTLLALPAGLATPLSRTLAADDEDDAPEGTTLSLGQWQRVALARSLMRADADLVILDEPNAGLDAEAEHRLHRTLDSATQGRTRVLVSHRLGTLRSADRIAVLVDGAIAEIGAHDELMAHGGTYARLFSLQAHGYRNVPGSDAIGAACG